MVKHNTFVISIGGSTIIPSAGINTNYLKKLKKLINKHKKNNKFFLITGGGSICRQYNEAAQKITKATAEDMDWMGIAATRLNAQLVRTIFGKDAHHEIIENPHDIVKTNKKIIIGAGWKPGCSSDYDAVLIADNYKASTVINLTNTDYVYDKDPAKYENAEKITNTSWKDFRKIVGNKWKPGLNMPFDPIASKKAEKIGLRVIIANGKKINNLERIIKGDKFVGTIVS